MDPTVVWLARNEWWLSWIPFVTFCVALPFLYRRIERYL